MATAYGACLKGMEAYPVEVECHLTGGSPGMVLLGAGGSGADSIETTARLRCALRAGGFRLPQQKVVFQLEPPCRVSQAPGLDLAMACALLAETGQAPAELCEGTLAVGGLNMHGGVGHVRGGAAYERLSELTGRTLVRADDPAWQAVTAGALLVGDVGQLRGGLGALARAEVARTPAAVDRPADVATDLPAVPEDARNVLVWEPAGCDGMAVAEAVRAVLPPMTDDERAEAALVSSVMDRPWDGSRPVVDAWPWQSRAVLIGGGRPVAPGMVSAAHGGVLVLHDLEEWMEASLRALTAVVEEGEARIVRADGLYRFPADTRVVGLARPCPCGHYGDPGHACGCSAAQVSSWQERVGKVCGSLFDAEVWAPPARTRQRALGPEVGPDRGNGHDRSAAHRGR